MSSGSYFTLYRHYKPELGTLSENDLKSLKDRYIEFYKTNSFSLKFSSSEKDTEEESREDLEDMAVPTILDSNSKSLDECFDEKTPKTVEESRVEFNKYVLAKDGTHLDKMLSWDFGSTFTALKEDFLLNPYRMGSSTVFITREQAREIYQACEYLLSRKWDDDFERILNNRWINIMAECGTYYFWEYLYRNNKKELNSISDEEKDEAEYIIKRVRDIMLTFISIDSNDWDKYNYLLAYTVW